MERLAFGYGTSRHTAKPRTAPAASEPSPAATADAAGARLAAVVNGAARRAARLGLPRPAGLHRAAVLPAAGSRSRRCASLHLAEIAALFALGCADHRPAEPRPVGDAADAGAGRRPRVRVVILATAPFSVWMGGAVGTFTDLYVKVVLIFVLMVNTLTSPKRMRAVHLADRDRQRLHRVPRRARLRARHQPDRKRPRAGRRSAACSRTRTTWR